MLRALPYIAYISLAAIFIWLRVDTFQSNFNIDESIVLKISQAMSERGNLDPNWKYIRDFEMFSYPQYNFYVYNVMAHFVLQTSTNFSELQLLRLFNLLLQGSAIALVWAGLRNLKQQKFVLICAMTFLTIAPALVHSSHMARAESMIDLMVAGIFYSRTTDNRRKGAIIAGACLAIGTATKITFGSAALILLPTIVSSIRAHRWDECLCFCMSFGVTLIVVAPYIFLNFADFENGIRVLSFQYGWNVDSPHVVMPGLEMAWRMGSFFFSVYGLVIVGGTFAIILYRKMPQAIFGLWLFAAASFLYFTRQSLFLERNLEPAVFCILIIAAWALGEIRRPPFQWVAVIMFVSPMTYWATQIAIESKHHGASAYEWKRLHNAVDIAEVWNSDQDACRRMIAIDYGDAKSQQWLQALLRDPRRKVISRYKSAFTVLPASTLQTYLDHDLVLLGCTVT